MDFREELASRIEEVNEIIDMFLPDVEGYQKLVFEAMNYSVHAGGKRIRPIFMMESAKLFESLTSEQNAALKSFMAAIELIHTYSLVHDDLPAMDNDDFRRGQYTTHKKYGHAMGILAGDGLLNYAFEVATSGLIASNDKDRAAEALLILGTKSGAYGMLGGQVVDVENTGKALSKEQLDFIYEKKTAALIEVSFMVGAILAGASDDELDRIEMMAKKIGLAFQIQDDILDVTSTTDVLGKPVLSDEKNEKTTYVTLYGVEKAAEYVREYTREALEILDSFTKKNEFLKELIISLIDRVK